MSKSQSFFWDVTLHRLVVGYLRFGTTYQDQVIQEDSRICTPIASSRLHCIKETERRK
jgi:hypothetical protein